MKLQIDTDSNTLTIENEGLTETLDLYTKAAFEKLSHAWMKVGWNQKYSYTFTWLGCPIIQLPEDVCPAHQELIFQVQPDVIVETGIAHGGSLIFYASLCHAMGKSRVIGVDVEIREHNLKRLEQHALKKYVTLIEGDSVAESITQKVKSQIDPDDKVMVILDSNHTYQHVMNELHAYADMVTKGSYIIVTDGVMKDLHDVPRGAPHWQQDNPTQAALDFIKDRKDFVLEQPKWLFNESELNENITYYPQGWLRKI